MISIRTEGVDRVADALQAVTHGLEDLRPFWPAVTTLWGGWMRQQFGSEGGWGGAAWAGLAPSTVAQKAADGYGSAGILVRTGTMRNAATAPARAAGATTLVLTIEDDKVSYHQDGTTKMVARPIIPPVLPGSAQAQLVQAADDYIDELLARWGV